MAINNINIKLACSVWSDSISVLVPEIQKIHLVRTGPTHHPPATRGQSLDTEMVGININH